MYLAVCLKPTQGYYLTDVHCEYTSEYDLLESSILHKYSSTTYACDCDMIGFCNLSSSASGTCTLVMHDLVPKLNYFC